MHVDHLTASITTLGGGIPVAIQSLVKAQQHLDVFPRVLGWDEGGQSLEGWSENVTKKFPYARRLGLPIADGLKQFLQNNSGDLIHLHGLWTGVSNAACRLGKPYLISPHGMLDPWALKLSKWKKILAGYLFERRNLSQSSCLHALCASEYISIRNFRLNNPVCILPNGVHLPDNKKHRRQIPESEKLKTILFLGRVHPKKGLFNALRGWKKVSTDHQATSWRIVISGWNQDGYEEELKMLCKDLEIPFTTCSVNDFIGAKDKCDKSDSVIFLGPTFGDHKEKLFLSADAFILPSYSEGLPMAVLEAWSYGLPVVMTDHCNLPEGFEAGAAIRVETSPESISNGLSELFQFSDSDLHAMGMNGRRLVEKQFTWPQVAAQMKEVYEWVLGGGSKPSCVEI